MHKIKFGEVEITEKTKLLVMECLNSGHVTLGPKTKELEAKWSETNGHQYTVAVNSGTSAVMTMAMSLYDDLSVQPNDEIIVPALSFIATANAVRAAGFKPVFVDVDRDTMNIIPELIEEKITNKTRAIIAVNLMGKPVDVAKLLTIADKHGLKLFCDGCEQHSALYNGKVMESYFDAVAYSCYAAHILFSGEFGFVSTNNINLYESGLSIRSHGRQPNSLYFDHSRFGLNLKPTDLHACIGLGGIEKYWDTFNRRYSIWKNMRAKLSKFENVLHITSEEENCRNSPHGMSLTVKEGSGLSVENLKSIFDDNLVEWKRNFGSMPHHGTFNYLGHKPGDFPNAEWVGNNGIHVGTHFAMTEDDVDRIVNCVEKFVK